MANAVRAKRNRKQPPKKVYSVRCGNPDKSRITTSHVERVNLTMRHFNKRFARKTISYSKKEECLAHSVFLFTAHYNFCKVHKGIIGNQTPAMASKLTEKTMDMSELLCG